MRVQNNRLYAFLACIFDENSHMCPTRARMKQSGCTLFRQPRSELNSRTLSSRLAVRAAISAWQLNTTKNVGDATLARVNA